MVQIVQVRVLATEQRAIRRARRDSHDDATAVLVLAAGAGTRMRSDTPKVLHTLAGRSMLAHALHAVAKVAPQHLVVVVGKDRDHVAPAVAAAGRLSSAAIIDIAVQEEQLGTGHAVGCGLAALPADFTGTVVVTSGDVPLLDADTLADLIAAHGARVRGGDGADHDAGRSDRLRPHPAHPGRRGHRHRRAGRRQPVAAGHHRGQRRRLRVRHRRAALGAEPAALRQRPAGAVPDRRDLDRARSDGHVVRAKHVDDTALVAGVNDRVQLAELGAELNRRIVAAHQRAGVTIVDPATTWIDVDVTIGRDTVVHPGTQLLGATRIGERLPDRPRHHADRRHRRRRAPSVVRTHGSQSAIGDGAAVGPFTYLRPGTVLGADGKLGAFVETKNATIGAGTKVPHLTYVGDADIGEHSNIGASSVFVNYDGETKSRTTIGSHVRTGSDTMFVAPVTVGDGAYTGAGTVVREDVPPGALAVSAGPQRNIEGWVARKRPGSAAAEAAGKGAKRPPTASDDEQ